MIVTDTPLPPVVLVTFDPFTDSRGRFQRLHCQREFEAHGLPGPIVQTSLSQSARRGTVRGMHFQMPPSKEAKLVRCLRGAIHDVVIDLRFHAKTFLQHFATELDSGSNHSLYVPPGFAHGFQTLEDDTQVLYQMTDFYSPELASGVRWDDPTFGIVWPLAVSEMSSKDADFPDFDPRTDLGFVSE